MNFIKNVAEGKIDGPTHRAFIRYGIGEFEKEPLKIARSASKVKLSGGFEYVNSFNTYLASLAKGEVSLSGNIITAKDVKDVFSGLGIEPISVEKVRGVSAYKYIIGATVSSANYKKLCQEFYDCFLILNAEDSEGRVLKLKKDKPPKIGKMIPAFAKLELPGSEGAAACKEFLFDVPGAENVKSAEVNHTYIINDIKIPKEFENDPEQARLRAMRKGEIKRTVVADGKEYKSTIKLEA